MSDSRFRTISAYVSGAIAGPTWGGTVGALPLQVSARVCFETSRTFEGALAGLLNRSGGDFCDARFTADTVLRIERRRIDGAGRYTVHVFERPIAELRDCADHVWPDRYTGDFLAE